MDEDRGAISRMQDTLYSRTAKTGIRPRASLSAGGEEVERGWAKESPEEELPRMPNAPRKPLPLMPLFFGALLFFVVAVGVAAYMFFYGGNTVSSSNITITILGPSLIDGGKETSLEITIENRNASALELSDLIIEYPEGTRSAEDLESSLPSERISLGTIEPGGRVKQTVRAVFFGEEGSQKRILATLEYRVAGSNAVFVKEGELMVLLGASPVAVSIEGPDEAVSGQEISFTVSVRSNAQTDIENVALEGQYPFGFSVTGSDPETSVGEGLWQLGSLKPGEEKKVTVTGRIDGQDNEERVFRFLAGSEGDLTAAHVSVPYLIVPKSLTLKRPFIGGSLSLNGDQGKTVVVESGTTVRGQIAWENNLDTEVTDLVIEAKLSGQALDRGSVIASRGFYRSLDSTIVWSKDDDQDFARVAPGEGGTVDFTFTASGSSGSTIITNPEIAISVSVGGKRVSEAEVPEGISSVFSKTIRVGSALAVETRTRHFSGPIQNAGPMPPKADQETTYTIGWTVKNPSNTVSGSKATATLPSYVKYLGASTPGSENLTYDERSRTVTWNLGDVKAGTGFGQAARTVSFKVGLTPSASQVGTTPALTGRVVLTGDDRFTGSRVSTEGDPSTISIEGGESGYSEGMNRVAQ